MANAKNDDEDDRLDAEHAEVHKRIEAGETVIPENDPFVRLAVENLGDESGEDKTR